MIDFHCDNCEFLQDKSNDNIIDGYCKKYNQSLTFYDWFEKCDKCLIETLQSENAALRERLDKAVELPCKVGDNVFCIVGIDPAVEEFEVEEILIKRLDPIFAVFRLRGIDIGVKTSCVLSQFGKRWFTELEAAEARLAELKGGKE